MSNDRCWVDIDLAALKSNCEMLHSLLPAGGRMLNILKANAYGHGSVPVARTLEKAFPKDWIGVACLSEALELRKAGIHQEILILGKTSPEYAPVLSKNNITQTLISPRYTQQLSNCAAKAGIVVSCHLKLDTGMNRTGYLTYDDALASTLESAIAAYHDPNLKVSGIYTHFSSASLHGEEDTAYTKKQFERFISVCEALRKYSIKLGLRHCCNSVATVDMPEYTLDMCRAGMALYGPLPNDGKERTVHFKPVMTWKARVALIRPVPVGLPISYNRTFSTLRNSMIAVISAGDADGYSRQLSNKGRVRIRGHICPVIGRVCMDMFMVDVTDYPDIQEDDEVLLMGGEETGVPREWLYEPLNSGPGAITCGIGPRVERNYITTGL